MNHVVMRLSKHRFVNTATALRYARGVTSNTFQRARTAEAKRQREDAIVSAAARLAGARGVREITLTDIAAEVGMHKSALLRYFETREQIFLELTAAGWREWGPELRARLEQEAVVSAPGLPGGDDNPGPDPAGIAAAFADTLTARPVFCDLLAQTPLNLERNVSVEAVRAFKLVTHAEVDATAAVLHRLLGLTEAQAVDVISTAVSLAGALWQMATPGPELAEMYRSDPRLGHAVVEVAPRLTRVLTALLQGLVG
jgi:AcrR family transcriptional regulator